MKKLFLISVSFFLILSCTKESQNLDESTQQFYESQIISNLLVEYEIPANDINLLQKLGFGGSIAKVFENHNTLTNENYISYIMEGDIELKANELSNHLPIQALEKTGSLTSQYRTTVIANPNNYTVAISSYPLLYGTINTGIQRAIQNYNNLNLGINFTLITATTAGARKNCSNDPNCILVSNFSGEGGLSGYPYNNGKPYNRIHLNTYLGDDFGTDVVEHVMTHELGHCIGLRHTDYFNRSISCGIGGNEGQGSYGAIHIPGTPQTFNIDINSIMKACFNDDETGEFTNYDIIALSNLW
ncbi:M57 family metalloprotease [Flagellimonas zhangzhouensis]|uniref:Dual-action HEIGH metallo-peptidase n=1 Tax=Flagellimonas zhangzhouensis TaxID=1073328 RepID=A0A1H2QRV8_9FLAO|nr:M57 family metalloprotease [Allomuricauda zhangzhouensis]SDQ56154.1 Dual-action HEIGH metallo-peptidase [Allomuricauda zhangzhouensis]SDW09902.1 Dual-action HEIGH metallo-peptidase [Allomuricauda zhangzhouensis]